MAATGIEGDRPARADGSETRELTLFVSGASDLSLPAKDIPTAVEHAAW
jgi:hypothetical protein